MNLLETPAVLLLGSTLLHFLWQAALVHAALRLCLAQVRSGPSRTRHAAAMTAVSACVLVPCVTAWILASPPALSAPASVRALGIAPATAESMADVFVRWQATIVPWLPVAWAVGIAAAVVGCAGAWHFTRRLRATASIAPAEWQRCFDALLGQAGITRRIPLLSSQEVAVPTVAGLLRPAVLLPADGVETLSSDALEAVLAHEVAHLRRRDPLMNLGLLAVEALFGFHPSVRRICACVRREREHCCDDEVVASRMDVLTYARALAALEERRPRGMRLALHATGGELLPRVRRLLAPKTPQRGGFRAATLIAAATAVVLATVTWGTAGLMPHLPLGPEMHIHAMDPAGTFTLRVRHGRVVGATVAGAVIPSSLLRQERDSVYILSPRGSTKLAVRLWPRGITWKQRQLASLR